MSVTYALETSGASSDQASVYGFTLGAYDPSLPLVIDPAVLVYCGFIGGSGDDYGYGIAVDSAGYAYVTGDTASNQTSFPEKVGPDLTYNGGTWRRLRGQGERRRHRPGLLRLYRRERRRLRLRHRRGRGGQRLRHRLDLLRPRPPSR